MAYQTGVASDHIDLWDKLKAFLTTDPALVAAGQNWSVAWEAASGAAFPTDIVLKGPGMAGDDEVFIGLRRVDAPQLQSFFIRMVGMTGVLPGGVAYNNHVNVSDNVVMFLDQNPMKYWFVANGRRFVVVVKVSTVYETLYGGLFLPYADPTQYPYPLMVGGSAGASFDENYNWTNTQFSHSQFITPQTNASTPPNDRGSLYFLDPSAQWVAADNKDRTSSIQSSAGVAPYHWLGGLGTHLSASNNVGYPTLLDRTLGCLGGSFALQPVTLVQRQPTDQTYGVFHGVYQVSGNGNPAENIIEMDGVDHLVVQNVWRTTPNSYWALALE
ncbi:hypothetical protein D3C87_855530 [compost metagenome]